MVYVVQTILGSQYVIDTTKMTWRRTHLGKDTPTRKTEGNLMIVPDITVGEGMWLHDTDVRPGCVTHAVYTADVANVAEFEDGELKEKTES